MSNIRRLEFINDDYNSDNTEQPNLKRQNLSSYLNGPTTDYVISYLNNDKLTSIAIPENSSSFNQAQNRPRDAVKMPAPEQDSTMLTIEVIGLDNSTRIRNWFYKTFARSFTITYSSKAKTLLIESTRKINVPERESLMKYLWKKKLQYRIKYHTGKTVAISAHINETSLPGLSLISSPQKDQSILSITLSKKEERERLKSWLYKNFANYKTSTLYRDEIITYRVEFGRKLETKERELIMGYLERRLEGRPQTYKIVDSKANHQEKDTPSPTNEVPESITTNQSSPLREPSEFPTQSSPLGKVSFFAPISTPQHDEEVCALFGSDIHANDDIVANLFAAETQKTNQ